MQWFNLKIGKSGFEFLLNCEMPKTVQATVYNIYYAKDSQFILKAPICLCRQRYQVYIRLHPQQIHSIKQNSHTLPIFLFLFIYISDLYSALLGPHFHELGFNSSFCNQQSRFTFNAKINHNHYLIFCSKVVYFTHGRNASVMVTKISLYADEVQNCASVVEEGVIAT